MLNKKEANRYNYLFRFKIPHSGVMFLFYKDQESGTHVSMLNREPMNNKELQRKGVNAMQLYITGDGDGFEFRLFLRWRSLRSLLVAVGALLAAPFITQLGAQLGWW
jgi:hypothetical protein